jgi:hypothetical protein
MSLTSAVGHRRPDSHEDVESNGDAPEPHCYRRSSCITKTAAPKPLVDASFCRASAVRLSLPSMPALVMLRSSQETRDEQR